MSRCVARRADVGHPAAPLARLLARIGYRGYLSLELFIETFGDTPALEVAKRGLDSIKRAYTLVSAAP